MAHSTALEGEIPQEGLAGLHQNTWIAGLAAAAILLHLTLRHAVAAPAPAALIPLWVVLVAGGAPLLWTLGQKAVRRQFGSDLLAGISIVTAVLLGEYLVGCIVVLML